MQHSKALLLVNDHKPQILEIHIRLHQPMRADDNVYRTGGQILHHLLLLSPASKTGEQLDAHRIIRHALDEGVEVLLRQHGRRHQHRHLPAAHHRLECRAHGHLRFAKTHVAANQPIHRPIRFHVRLGGGDGLILIRCFLVQKSRFKFALPGGIRAKRVAFL